MTTNSAHHPILDITRIAVALKDAEIGHNIDYHASVDSTMAVAHRLAVDPATRSGTIVVAEEQTSGLGRLQRRWLAPPNQALLATLILKAPHLPANIAFLPMIAGIAAVRAIAWLVPDLTDDLGLKWPNDVVIGADLAGARKTGGILIESSFLRDQVDFALVGIGINVNQDAATLPVVPADAPPPTSLRVVVGRTIDRTALLIALCRAWEELVSPDASPHDIYHEWRNLLLTLGQPVTAHLYADHGATRITGRAVDVTPDGELVVVDEAGISHVLDAGDVTTRLPE
ncbi:MAG: biotin--[acetyl-CoA-carboxylase] ligase [Caldilinea sp.]|nr:biotin--[acetyl-CoA-carboxylase] ligase [Caldilinea sp.]MCB0060079.1 biotin--[acetyl-CoA-carboxylase] ligase [Caldilineaceae bacterium]MCB9115709.1 biotin--[acetyl-CoA-carboxylase] ligase [Caldilineaceae bacterium]MCB9120644.1 biotin--[acetyl-CoA-carboxylase] ligase [Caldilineaceae bacterium]MCB9124002.1 biotin--[acetyl-CoA-carboxylase] ligase [Caldilineaceae bacterium]